MRRDIGKVAWLLSVLTVGLVALGLPVYADGEELQLLHCWTGVRQPWVEEMTLAFEETYGVRVIAHAAPCNTLNEQFVITAAGGVPYDVVMLQSRELASFAESGMLASLAEFMDQEGITRDIWYPSEIAAGTVGDITYGFPIRTGGDANTLLFYNREHFAQTGLDPELPPQTLEELETASRLLVRYDGDQLSRVALPFWGGDEGALGWLYSAGGALLSDDGSTVLLDHPETIAAMTWIYDYFHGLYRGGFGDVRHLNTQGRLRQAFIDGSAAMIRGGVWEYAYIREGNPSLDFGMAVAPAKVVGGAPGVHVGTFVYAIPSGSDRADLAWELLKWLTIEEETAGYFMLRQGRPSPVQEFNRNRAYFDENPYWMVVGQALAATPLLPSTPHVNDILSIFTQARVEVMDSRQSPQAAFTEAGQRARAVMAE